MSSPTFAHQTTISCPVQPPEIFPEVWDSRDIAASVFDFDDIDALKVERDENDQRKTPTVSERVALAEAVSERLGGRQGRPEKGGNISTINDDAGKTRDIAAAKAEPRGKYFPLGRSRKNP